MSLCSLRLTGLPEKVCCCTQRRDWRVFFCLCPVILQKKAQTQQTREFHKKSIKEKAVHLSSLLAGGGPAELKVTAGFVIAPLASATRCPPQQHAHLHVETHHVLRSSSSLCLLASRFFFSFHHHLETPWARLFQHRGAWVCSTANIPLIGPKLNHSLLSDTPTAFTKYSKLGS